MWILGLKGLTTGELCSGLSQEPITGASNFHVITTWSIRRPVYYKRNDFGANLEFLVKSHKAVCRIKT